ncbi:MAG TPA: SMI1/KNR4 family protein [Verrucomicrobiae bacterium]|nr:SMI1/KNR4 family protein [Verrucomicrobiae bacterium]
MSRIIVTLDEIAKEARKMGVDIESNLNPGATEKQMSNSLARLPLALPDEILDLYRWHDGVRERRISDARIFPRFLFPSLEDCIDTTKELCSVAGDPEIRWRASWFYLCEDLAGDYYALETNPKVASGHIWFVSFGADPFVAFWSFETMLLSILECYKSGAYFLDADGFLDEQSELSNSIYRAHNCGLSPLRLISKEKLLKDMMQAKRKFELEMRPDLIDKLRELAGMSGINTDDW